MKIIGSREEETHAQLMERVGFIKAFQEEIGNLRKISLFYSQSRKNREINDVRRCVWIRRIREW